MKLNKILLGLFALVGVLLTLGCEQEGLTSFDTDFSAINFSADSTSYSFLGNSEDEYVEEVEVMILGTSSDRDRTFNVEVVNDELTTAEESDYEIVGGLVEAGSFSGILRIRLFKSEKLADETVSLHLKLVDSDDFEVGTVEANQFVLKWTDQVIVPAWTFYRFFFTSQPSTAAYRAIVESTGITQFTIQDYLAVGPAGAEALGRVFGDYVKEHNLQNPDNPLRHDDGPLEGELIEPIYYTQSKYD